MAAPTGEQSSRDANITPQSPESVAVFATTELAESIFELLHTKDIVRCQRVCQMLKGITTSTTSKIIKQKLFLQPLPDRCIAVQSWLEAAVISPRSTFFCATDWRTEGPGQALTINPALAINDVDFRQRSFWFDSRSLLRLVGQSPRLAQTLISQPPATAVVLIPEADKSAVEPVTDHSEYDDEPGKPAGQVFVRRSAQVGMFLGDLVTAFTKLHEHKDEGDDLTKVMVRFMREDDSYRS